MPKHNLAEPTWLELHQITSRTWIRLLIVASTRLYTNLVFRLK